MAAINTKILRQPPGQDLGHDLSLKRYRRRVAYLTGPTTVTTGFRAKAPVGQDLALTFDRRHPCSGCERDPDHRLIVDIEWHQMDHHALPGEVRILARTGVLGDFLGTRQSRGHTDRMRALAVVISAIGGDEVDR